MIEKSCVRRNERYSHFSGPLKYSAQREDPFGWSFLLLMGRIRSNRPAEALISLVSVRTLIDRCQNQLAALKRIIIFRLIQNVAI